MMADYSSRTVNGKLPTAILNSSVLYHGNCKLQITNSRFTEFRQLEFGIRNWQFAALL